jgi:hypothetical protein
MGNLPMAFTGGTPVPRRRGMAPAKKSGGMAARTLKESGRGFPLQPGQTVAS